MELKDYKKIIENRRATEAYKYFTYGEDYFRQRNTAIMERKKLMCLQDGTVTENYFAANHKLPSGFFPQIIKQEVNYLIGNGVSWVDADEQGQELDAYFDTDDGTGFEEHAKEMMLNARKKGEAWAYAYKEGNALKFASVPAEQTAPYYDDMGRLKLMIRTYRTSDKLVMLVYDDTVIKRYEKASTDKDYEYLGDYGHYTEYSTINGNIIEEIPHGFGQVPWFPLYSDDEGMSALYPLKLKIDTYDVIESDFANNITDFQEIFYTLKGYQADPGELAKFMHQLKTVKAMPIPADGDIKPEQFDVPTEARETFLKRLKDGIYADGMAVDFSTVAGGSITNVVMQAMITNLDVKCNDIEMQLRLYVNRLIRFINRIDGKSYTSLFRLDRSLPMNYLELSERIEKALQGGYISKQSAAEASLLELDWETELERMAAETSPYTLDDLPEEETDPGGEE